MSSSRCDLLGGSAGACQSKESSSRAESVLKKHRGRLKHDPNKRFAIALTVRSVQAAGLRDFHARHSHALSRQAQCTWCGQVANEKG